MYDKTSNTSKTRLIIRESIINITRVCNNKLTCKIWSKKHRKRDGEDETERLKVAGHCKDCYKA